MIISQIKVAIGMLTLAISAAPTAIKKHLDGQVSFED